jgi:hypothetical protein
VWNQRRPSERVTVPKAVPEWFGPASVPEVMIAAMTASSADEVARTVVGVYTAAKSYAVKFARPFHVDGDRGARPDRRPGRSDDLC